MEGPKGALPLLGSVLDSGVHTAADGRLGILWPSQMRTSRLEWKILAADSRWKIPVCAGMGRLTHGASQNMTRLYVVVSKGVSEDILTRLFRAFPGLEYCDLKRDHTTGQSRVSVCKVSTSNAREVDACECSHSRQRALNSHLTVRRVAACLHTMLQAKREDTLGNCSIF